jgi:hypothetical protein
MLKIGAINSPSLHVAQVPSERSSNEKLDYKELSPLITACAPA